MLQAKTKRYDINTLLPSNETYHDAHTLIQEDVDKVNELVERIESSRSKIGPKAGDRLLYTSKHGEYSPVAFIEKNRDGDLFVCVKPMIPFVESIQGEIHCNVSGGPFAGMSENELIYAGTVNNHFKTWGHGGPKANGAVNFQAGVSMWEYTEQVALFGEFTTKAWRKITLVKTDPAAEYLYKGDGFTFGDEKEYQDFLRSFYATVFPGYWENQFVIWCYRDELKGLPIQEWEAINAPVMTRKIGVLQAKVKIREDHENHKVMTLYVQPE
ncbi:MAG: DUF4121 family protein [Tannerellaceae bacterium]|jgi:hypothetical protein|nr:DUF4121 family protein [Tannerellaceae bacterium]